MKAEITFKEVATLVSDGRMSLRKDLESQLRNRQEWAKSNLPLEARAAYNMALQYVIGLIKEEE